MDRSVSRRSQRRSAGAASTCAAGFAPRSGLSPKRAAQLVRLDHAARRLAAGQAAASVAAESGYVDQAHLHRDAMAFAGLTPIAVAVAPWLAVDDIAWPASQHVSEL
jgi:AraC-like DNA-binding protein